MEARREFVLARLNQRHKKLEIRSNDATNGHDITDSASNDVKRPVDLCFNDECLLITEELESVRNGTTRQSTDSSLSGVANGITKLQALFNESFSDKPAYERCVAAAKLQELVEKMKGIKAELKPQRQFTFTKLTPAETRTVPFIHSSSGTDVPDVTSRQNFPALLSSSSVGIQGCHGNESHILSQTDCEGKDVLLADCRSCTIRVLGISGTIYARGLLDSTILCHPVTSSIFIENCQRSTFVVACQQLRMHSSLDCQVYLRVTTTPIIEDCRGITFAPYLDAIDGETEMEELFEKAGLNRSEDYWDKVQDFNWLATDRPSPSWGVLPAENRRRYAIKKT